MIEQGQPQPKQAPIAAIGAVNNTYPILSPGYKTEVHDPQVRQARRNHEGAQALGIGQMTFMQVKSAAFLVGEEGFDLKAFLVPMTGFATQLEIGHQKDGFEVTAFPPGNDRHWAIAFERKADVWNTDLIAWAQGQISERKEYPIFIKPGILGRPANITQVQRLQSRLELNPIEFTIPQEDRPAVLG